MSSLVRTVLWPLVQDPLIYGNAERYLQLAIQCVLDVSNHVVADLRLNLPADNKEFFETLAAHKILPKVLSANLEIDRHRVYSVLKNDLGDYPCHR